MLSLIANKKFILALLIGAAMLLSSCGGDSNTPSSHLAPTLTGNWQFTVANPADQSFLGGLQGGFLVNKKGAVTGGAIYSVSLPSQNGGSATVCNSGSASITG